MFQAGCSEKDLSPDISQLWRAGRLCGVREECLPVAFWNELCPHDLNSQKKIPHTDSLQKPPQSLQENPNHENPHRPGNRLNPRKNSSLSFKKYLRQLPQQTDWGYNRHRPWHAGPFVPAHSVKSGLQNRAHPTGTALRTQEGLQTPRPPVRYFHQEHEINSYKKRAVEVKVKLGQSFLGIKPLYSTFSAKDGCDFPCSEQGREKQVKLQPK